MGMALNTTALALEAIGIEITSMGASVLLYPLVLDMITTAQGGGGACAMLQQECCVCIVDEESLINHNVDSLYLQSSGIHHLEDDPVFSPIVYGSLVLENGGSEL